MVSDSAFSSFPNGFRTVVFGASGGIGAALVQSVAAAPQRGAIYALSRKDNAPCEDGLKPLRFDLRDEASIASAASDIGADGPVHLVIVATGLLHRESTQPEKSWRALNADAMAELYAINTIGPALIGKHMLPLLAKGEKAVFAALGARVGSISDNALGGWHAYRASKAALAMIMQNFAIELRARNASAACILLHPGTVDTALSAPFQAGMKADSLMTPVESARRLSAVLDSVDGRQSGRHLAWDGAVIPA